MSLPRVTYSNIGVDFSPVHDHLDRLIPDFERDVLGKEWKTAFATNQPQRFASPIDPTLALGLFPSTSASDIDAAVQAAKNGAAIWNNSTVAERLDFAARWYKVLEEDKYQLGLAALYEVGKSRLEAIGEAEEAVDMLEFYPEELRKNNGYVRPMNELIEKETATSVLRPYGVFAVIAPFNFPVALSIGMIVGALLGGNSVVYKPSPECQLTGLLIAEGLRKAGLPDGVFNIVLGDGEVGRQLAQHKGVDGVAFTGSHKTGMSIFRNMANGPWMKPVIAEMGGKNPAYVTKNADIARAAQGVVRSAFGLQGQKCSACSVVYVDEDVKDEFIQEFKKFAETIAVGDPRKRETFMGPLYNSGTVERFKSAIEEVSQKGTIHYGGTPLGDDFPANYFVGALAEMPGPSRLTKDEFFMPFVVLRSVKDLKEGLAEGNDVSYGLAAGVYSRDQSEVQFFLDNAQAGVLYANRASGATTGAWPGAQPFCGWKGTGVSGKGGLGTWFIPQFMREQSHTIMTV
ncbi:aldehyde dehydrogenase family protein [Paracoccus pantotrophus]|uniref:L-glutamate gamma-semialdehyde dehydrogenase n=1 Tax=Paracoccus pantotrophus TaxID=82367 RepID=A0A7H9BPV9_PARPN|nr:aldehyde dehydrogenase family protein [Paracoccus pantotrophus]QLH13063.1 aldehyde dehydrogenase family protein [Paracoccus pantotrophus]